MSQKNMIFIVADQLRYDVLGKGYTPNIDALIKESVAFEQAYCSSPLCVPARGALFTGLCPNTNGSIINPWTKQDADYGNVKAEYDDLYQLMERSGYECIHSGKQHFFTEGSKLEERKELNIHWVTTEHTYQTFLKDNAKKAPGGARFRTPCPEMVGGSSTRFCTYSNAETACYEEGLPYYFDGY